MTIGAQTTTGGYTLDAQEVRAFLINDGWLSPDTYCNCFAPLNNDPAVYLFLLYQREDYREAIVAYVGMSTKLSQRMIGHEVLAELHAPECWPMRWFKPTRAQDLRTVEREYIARFDPPWNIIGRRRGVNLR